MEENIRKFCEIAINLETEFLCANIFGNAEYDPVARFLSDVRNN